MASLRYLVKQSVLCDWFNKNRDFPYPDKATLNIMAKQVG